MRRLLWLAGAVLAVLASSWLVPASVQAGTVTIVDGPDTPPVDGIYTDGYIQNYLAITGSLAISTTSVITGPDEIRVLQSAVITWTSSNTLTLDAGTNVVISGTLQHDGPATGEGRLRLLASGVPTGTVYVGPGDQTAGVAVGSRFGLTRVRAGNLVLKGGNSGTEPFALLGYHAVDQGVAYTVTGAISVTVSQNLTARAGAANLAFVQIGHGGADTGDDTTSSGSFSGVVAVDAGGDVIFQGNRGPYAYVQFGNGGVFADGNHSGDHRLSAGGNVIFQGGDSSAYAQLGNGGEGATGNHSGDHLLDAGGDVTFQAGKDHAQFGNGGYRADGSHSGGHTVTAAGDVTFQGSSGDFAYAQLGNGVVAAFGNHSGDHRLDAGGNVTFQGGDGEYAYAQLGNGGYDAIGNHSGSLALTSTGNLTLTVGGGADAYAMLGHGADTRLNLAAQSTGSRAGDISVRVGETATFSGSQVGHLTASGVLSVTQTNTFVGVGQNDPDGGAGRLLITGVTTSSFSSAPSGELRFYLPRADSQQIPTSAAFNGSSFATANTIPPDQLQGFYVFGDGPYSAPYSFYLGGQPDLAITKAVVPAGLVRPGQVLTYIVSFSNTGTLTATGVVISDSLPGLLSFGSVTPLPDAGVVISQTSGPPALACSVSPLAPGKGGQLVLTATLQVTPVTTFITNTVTIAAGGDINLDNNTASVSREVVPAVGKFFLPVLQKQGGQ